MRTLLYAIPALLALAGTALAEPQQLDEAQLGGIAAGQTEISTISENTNFSTNSFSTSAVEETSQILNGVSSNTTYATGVSSSDVSAMGTAGVSVMGNINGGSPSP
jgi:hypothetical protein